MSKNAADVKSVDANCEFYFGPVATPLPDAATEVLNAGFESAGYLEDPPDFSLTKPTSDITAWNSDDPIRTLIESENLEVTIKLQQTNALSIELYWGLGEWADDGVDGAVWTPVSGEVVKAGVLHLTDGTDTFRFAAERFSVSKVGKLNVARAQAVSYEVTLKRLAGAFTQLYSWVPDGVTLAP